MKKPLKNLRTCATYVPVLAKALAKAYPSTLQSSETVPLIFKNDVNVALKSNKKISKLIRSVKMCAIVANLL